MNNNSPNYIGLHVNIINPWLMLQKKGCEGQEKTKPFSFWQLTFKMFLLE